MSALKEPCAIMASDMPKNKAFCLIKSTYFTASSALLTASRIEILSLLKNICRTDDVGILLSSHDVSQAMRMSDRIVLVDKNREISVGTPNDLIRDNKIQNMFNNPDIIYDQSQSDFILK